MELPTLLPAELNYASVATTDRILFNLMGKIPQDFIVFFEYACDDETWSGLHTDFMKNAIEWLTNQFFEDQLLMTYAQKAARAIQKHSLNLNQIIPNNITINYDKEYSTTANSLMWSASSETLRTIIRRECRDKRKTFLNFPTVSSEVFNPINEYITTGSVPDLWRKEKSELFPILRQATIWGLSGLMEIIEDLLKKYIDESNVLEILLLSQKEKWLHLRNACMDYVNNMGRGVSFDTSLQELNLEFLEFSDKALTIFEKLRQHILRLIISRNLPEHPQFSEVINQCPQLVCLDISRSESFSDRLVDIPSSLQELRVEKCSWLSNRNLSKLLEICPSLSLISLASNTQITYAGWTELQNMRNLQKLDISKCYQVSDDEFKLILQACRGVVQLKLQECMQLTDRAFQELGRNIPNLTDLDISRCHISDGALVDLASRCRLLVTLTLVRCTSLTEKSIVEAARIGTNLQILNIEKCNVTPEDIEKINKLRPFLQVIS